MAAAVRCLLGAAIAGLLLTLGAPPAFAHASLVATTPADGEQLEQAPERVTLSFDEPVSVPTGGMRVYDRRGERVDVGAPRRPSPDSAVLDLPPLDDGSYIVTWRAVSADGHPIRGALLFTVGDADAVDESVMARLFAGGDGWAVPVFGVLVRAAGYAGTLLFAGAVLFAAFVGAADRDRDRARHWARIGGLLGMVAALLAVPQHALALSGLGLPGAVAPAALGEALTSSVGVGALVRLLALAAGLALVRSVDGRPWPALWAGAVAVLSFIIDGHTRTVAPTALMGAGDAVHLLAAAAWFGGVVVLAGSLRDRAPEHGPHAAARTVGRFSTLAAGSLLAVAVSGGAMGWAAVRQPRALTSTGYGWLLVAKLVLVALIVGAAAYNNRVLVPAVRAQASQGGTGDGAGDTAGAWRRLRRTVRIEALGMLAVLLVTGLLVNQRPAAEAAGITGLFEAYAPLTEQLELQLVVDPNRAGRNEIHLYLLDRTGRPADAVEELVLELSMPREHVGPLVREPLVAGPGHWVHTGGELAIPGEWRIMVRARLDRFSQPSTSFTVVVNP